jgi:hypothetical protein
MDANRYFTYSCYTYNSASGGGGKDPLANLNKQFAKLDKFEMLKICEDVNAKELLDRKTSISNIDHKLVQKIKSYLSGNSAELPFDDSPFFQCSFDVAMNELAKPTSADLLFLSALHSDENSFPNLLPKEIGLYILELKNPNPMSFAEFTKEVGVKIRCEQRPAYSHQTLYETAIQKSISPIKLPIHKEINLDFDQIIEKLAFDLATTTTPEDISQQEPEKEEEKSSCTMM